MQPRVFLRSIDYIVSGLRCKELEDFLRPFFAEDASNFKVSENQKREFGQLLLDVKTNLGRLLQDSNTLSLIERIPLGYLSDPAKLADIIGDFYNISAQKQVVSRALYWHLYYTVLYMNRVATASSELLIAPAMEEIAEGRQVLELEVLDFEGQPIPERRLRRALGGMAALYDAFAELFSLEDAGKLGIGFIESGTNITIGFEGVAEIVEAIGSVFIQVWREIRYSRNMKLERDWKSLIDGLDVLQSIKEKVENGDLDEQQGARLEHVVRKHLENLIGDGVMLREVPDPQAVDRRDLLEHVRKIGLLEPGKGDNSLER